MAELRCRSIFRGAPGDLLLPFHSTKDDAANRAIDRVVAGCLAKSDVHLTEVYYEQEFPSVHGSVVPIPWHNQAWPQILERLRADGVWFITDGALEASSVPDAYPGQVIGARDRVTFVEFDASLPTADSVFAEVWGPTTWG